MYDLHTHSLLSDGVLVPSEVAVRYQAAGYKAIAITDHSDYSNIKTNVAAIMEFCRHWPKSSKIKVLPGIELTHLPLEQFKPLARYARRQGIKIIVAHGETTAEPVMQGTNRAALLADIDILAHPGRISDADAKLAAQRGIFLEVTCRKGHCASDAHVIRQARKFGARLIINSDSHEPQDILRPAQVLKIATKAGLTQPQVDQIYLATATLVRTLLSNQEDR